MRVTSDLWVSALLRRAFSSGGFAAVEKRGMSEAGAIFLTARDRFGTLRLFGPAPQAAYEQARPEDRLFQEIMQTDDPDALKTRLDRELRFDPDLWLVELEVDEAMLEQLVPLTRQ